MVRDENKIGIRWNRGLSGDNFGVRSFISYQAPGSLGHKCQQTPRAQVQETAKQPVSYSLGCC